MSSRSSIASDKDEIMFLGKECKHAHCHLNDFLPFACPACKQPFCQEHFLPSAHSCTAPLPPSMVDRIAPQCPLCNEVVSYPPGPKLDPNEAVERHILSGLCSGLEGGDARKKAELKRKKEMGKVCYRRGCTKVIVVPMKCDECTRTFCPTHRHKRDHSCTPTPSGSGTNTPVGGARPGAKTGMSRLLSSTTTTTTASSSKISTPASVSPAAKPRPNPVAAVQAAGPQLEARAAAAAAAMKRAGQDVKDVKVPFVKTKVEKRSDAELQSTIKALKARHDKGLLTKAEELKYAELVGNAESSRRKGDKKGDCIIA